MAPRTWALNSTGRFSAVIMDRLIRLRSCRVSPGRFHRSPQQYWVTYSWMSRENSVAAAGGGAGGGRAGGGRVATKGLARGGGRGGGGGGGGGGGRGREKTAVRCA